MLEVKSEDLQREQTAPAYEGMLNLSSDKIKRNVLNMYLEEARDTRLWYWTAPGMSSALSRTV